MSLRTQETRIFRILTIQHVQNGVDIQTLKSPGVGESSLLVPHVQSPVVEPDV